MSQFIILFAPGNLQREMPFGEEVAEFAKQNIDLYEQFPVTFVTEKTGVDAAEEAFDLTNNPCRSEDRRNAGFLNHRSLSTGDVVRVLQFREPVTEYVCLSVGWKKLD